MNNAVRSLEPNSLWNHFADLNAVPRASKKEERVIQFIVDFGKNLGLETIVDEVGNVIIKKPASKGMESKQTVVLQSHLDMVHQKNADTNFDFETEGIKMNVNEDWVHALGTTLGADNGIGVATIMAVLASNELAHPSIEALFTIDEETGMTGALGLKGGLLSGSILLNLDTEDDDELTIGCAGGVDVSATGTYEEYGIPEGFEAFKLSIKGLNGGHSGMDIHKGLGNANKLMNRVLTDLSNKIDLKISSIDGGGLRNAIPRESFAIICIHTEQKSIYQDTLNQFQNVLGHEHRTTDSDFTIQSETVEMPSKVLTDEFEKQILKALYACPNGIYRMTPEIPGLVQTSNNLARVLVQDGKYEVLCLTRSSVDSEKDDLSQAIRSVFELIGAEVNSDGSYPGWAPKPDAPIIKMMSDLYVEMFKDQPHVNACHAGLECGIIGLNYPDMDMISFGPNIRGAHSPDEKVQISSVQKYWEYFKEVMKRVPEK